MNFSDKLIHWYNKNKRDLPWRNSKNPYHIWLSEIILQQTRVEQGLPYYLKFVSNFKTIKALANAPEEKVMKLWQGLGYYSRARNLHAAAKQMLTQYKGNFPKTFEEIIALKGVGDYTASAIASFAYNLPHAVVDGNVYRVLSRVFGIETPIDSTKGKADFKYLAQELLDKKNPSLYNQAIMEFGALYCKPVNPDCNNCIFNDTCIAFEKKLVATLPIKEKKTKTRNRYFNYLLLNKGGNLVINKREEKDIWQNLHDFPLIESAVELSDKKLFDKIKWKQLVPNGSKIKQKSKVYKHILSHQIIYAVFWEIEVDTLPPNFIEIKRTKLKKYAVSRLVEIYLNSGAEKS